MPAIDKNKIRSELREWFDITGAIEIDDGGIINVTGDVDIKKDHPHGNRLPFQFGSVSGEFRISDSRLTSIAGCPRDVHKLVVSGMPGFDPTELSGITVSHELNLTNCGLKNLVGLPSAIVLDVSYNSGLTSLQGLPDGAKVKIIYARACSLVNLEGTPGSVRRIYIEKSHVPIKSLHGLPHRMQLLHADANVPCCMFLETEWMTGKNANPSPKFGKDIFLHGDKMVVGDIAAAFQEFWPLRHDGIPGFAFRLIKLGHRQNAQF